MTRLSVVLTAFFVALCIPTDDALGAKYQRAFGFGPSFFTGSAKTTLSPDYAAQLSYTSNGKSSKFFYFANRFDLGVMLGSQFGDQSSFYGFMGRYSPQPRFNFGKEGIVPYFEFGPTFGMFAIMLGSASSNTSKNQAAFKYGYSIGIGFDSVVEEEGGWGVNINHFRFFQSPAFLEFPAKRLTATGIQLEFRFIKAAK